MKKRDKRILAALIAGAVCLCGVAAASGGSASDPLVTLSYLNQTVTPNILNQVDNKVNAKAAELENSLNQKIASYTSQMEQALAGSGGSVVVPPASTTGSASFALVTLSGGQRLNLGVGTEVLLQEGAVFCVSFSSPGLVDSTAGGSIDNGAALSVNHLYLTTTGDSSVAVGSDTAKLLVRGGYTVT